MECYNEMKVKVLAMIEKQQNVGRRLGVINVQQSIGCPRETATKLVELIKLMRPWT